MLFVGASVCLAHAVLIYMSLEMLMLRQIHAGQQWGRQFSGPSEVRRLLFRGFRKQPFNHFIRLTFPLGTFRVPDAVAWHQVTVYDLGGAFALEDWSDSERTNERTNERALRAKYKTVACQDKCSGEAGLLWGLPRWGRKPCAAHRWKWRVAFSFLAAFAASTCMCKV